MGGPTAQTFALTYERSVQSDLFMNRAIDDVVEGATAGEVYVTNWLQYPIPAAGKKFPANTEEKMDNLKMSFTIMKMSSVTTSRRSAMLSLRERSRWCYRCAQVYEHAVVGFNGT